jgi:hypothetical protein
MARRNKIDALPLPLKADLERLLADRSHGGYEALSAWLDGKGYTVGKSSIHRHDQGRIQPVMERIKASAEAARLIVSDNPDAADEHSAAVIRMVQSQLFEAMMDAANAGEIDDPAERIKVLASAARAIAEASRASIGQKKWEQEVRERLDSVERAASKQGKRLDADTLKIIRDGLYGG